MRTVRETLNRNRMLSVVVCVCATGAAVVCSAWWSGGRSTPGFTGIPTKSFYSDDDGKTWFIDDLNKLVPFQHNGRPAVRAYIFRCGGGKPFVVYLEKYSDGVRAKINAAIGAHPDAIANALMEQPAEAKKPGETTWVSPGIGPKDAPYLRVITPSCPEGDAGPPEMVNPSDSSNGASN